MSYDTWKLANPPHYDMPEPEYFCRDCNEPLEEPIDLCPICEVTQHMHHYKNKGGNSSILFYKSGHHYITLIFSDYSVYRYTKNSVGEKNLNKMKKLAKKGVGLNSFISRNHPPYTYKKRGYEWN